VGADWGDTAGAQVGLQLLFERGCDLLPQWTEVPAATGGDAVEAESTPAGGFLGGRASGARDGKVAPFSISVSIRLVVEFSMPRNCTSIAAGSASRKSEKFGEPPTPALARRCKCHGRLMQEAHALARRQVAQLMIRMHDRPFGAGYPNRAARSALCSIQTPSAIAITHELITAAKRRDC
jgi:hypothetical protein